MKTREATLHAEESFAAAGTKIIPIRVTDPISRIMIPYGVTVGAAARLQHMAAAFTKIEIVDGSDVLLSLTGRQIDGIQRLDSHGPAASFTSPDPSITDYGTLVIDFGRYLYDKVLAFDPTKFRNPQIQLTMSLTTVEAACTAVIAAAHAYLMEDIPTPPIGFLMRKEIKSWVAANGAWEYTELPRDYTYRRLFLQALTKAVGVGSHWSQARLSEDNDKRIPFDVLVDDQVSKNAQDYGQITEFCSGIAAAVAFPLFAAPTYAGAVLAVDSTTTKSLYAQNLDGGQYTVLGETVTDKFRGEVVGLVPQGMVAFHMGPRDILEDLYDPRALGSLQLQVKGAGAQTIRLVSEQVRPY
jgi:hypothetical protein